MTNAAPLIMQPGEAVALARIPLVSIDLFRSLVNEEVAGGNRLVTFFGRDGGAGRVRLQAVLADLKRGAFRILSSEVEKAYPALTPECTPAWHYEAEIAENWGLVPQGHPWLKPVRFLAASRAGSTTFPGVQEFFAVAGEGVHEVAVGPVHAGVIEPGHFRFQCHGEEVFHLEIALGYQHRGVERALVGGPDLRTAHYMETLAGDTTIGHGCAYAEMVEALSGAQVPSRGLAVRAIALELERLANHVGDLGALAGDIGFLPTSSWCGRLRGDLLNLTALICGSRFGRGLVRPGGTAFDLDGDLVARIDAGLRAASRDIDGALDILFETPAVLARFEETGKVSAKECLALGLVGPAARACGVELDARRDFATGAYRARKIDPVTEPTGDVFARASVRRREIAASIDFILGLLGELPAGEVIAPIGSLAPESFAIALVEGWRGAVCHAAVTDASGRFRGYKVVDPSFHNWMGLALALRGGQISDFPLCNKSFNLSYCGHDL